MPKKIPINHYISIADLPHVRDGSRSVVLNNKSLWITGGNGWPSTGITNTTDFITIGEPSKTGPELPFATKEHCLVQITEDKVLYVGAPSRYSNAEYYIYNIQSQTWSNKLTGPEGSGYRQSCASFYSNDGKPKVLLAGFAYGTQIYDVLQETWTEGNEYF
jgi:hypothetical protein